MSAAAITTLPRPSGLAERYRSVRLASTALAQPLSAEDCCAQSMTDASPVKWHLAHTTWFFETFILEGHEADFHPYDPAFRMLFNSYYNQVGEQYPRAQRGLITRPGLDDVLRYRNHVDARMAALLETQPAPQLAALIELGLQHEQQHQELILTDVQHLLSHNPLQPAYASTLPPRCPPAQALQWRSYPGGVAKIGHEGADFCFDNELPRHRQFLEPYELGHRLVTNEEYLAFVQAGGYRDSSLWLSEGWAWLHARATPISHPLYWSLRDGVWMAYTLHGEHELDPHAAAVCLSYYEADAYARWAGARLPTEAEWEHAATSKNCDLDQLYDTAWQWTQSSYSPYPGYAPPQGAVGEYNGKFMVNQYVLRGASSKTPAGHSRASYRNFFPATARWQQTGIRLARSVPADAGTVQSLQDR